jgi:hypothetical protein
MTALGVLWNVEAERDLLALPPSDADRMMDAVELFASTGRGFVRVLLDGTGERRLYASGLYAVFEIIDANVVVLRVHAT